LQGGLISKPPLEGWIMEVAEKGGIEFQLEVLEGGTTDAAAIQLAQVGIPSAAHMIPSTVCP